jgi:hypothetical protein
LQGYHDALKQLAELSKNYKVVAKDLLRKEKEAKKPTKKVVPQLSHKQKLHLRKQRLFKAIRKYQMKIKKCKRKHHRCSKKKLKKLYRRLYFLKRLHKKCSKHHKNTLEVQMNNLMKELPQPLSY